MMDLATMLEFFNPKELRDLILATDVSDVMVNADGAVFFDQGGRLHRVPGIQAKSVKVGIQNIARQLGKDISEAEPILDARLPDGSRVGAVLSAGNEITLTIRKFLGWLTSDQLVEKGTVTERVRDILVAGICGAHGDASNILVSGGTSAGKTTFAKAILNHIPPDHRLIVIEKPRELSISHENAVRWEAEDAHPGEKAKRSVAQLLVAALRHRPDHIILGEVREPEAAYELLQATNTGHSGTLCTIHADSAEDALSRLGELALACHSNLSAEFVDRQVLRSIDYVVQCGRDRNGKRRVVELLEVKRDGNHAVLYPERLAAA